MTTITEGKVLPAVSVSSKGELVETDGKIKAQPWSTASLAGRVRVVQHMAGRSAAKELNEALIEALKKAEFPKDRYQTTTIINLNDAMIGTSGIVASKAESGKKEFPWSCVVLDAKGDVRKAWGLDKSSSAIAVLNADGEVLFFKDGALSADEVTKVITLVEGELAAVSA